MDHKLVVLLSGKIGSGKNTLADMILKELGDKASADAFARPLKEFCRDVFRPVVAYINETVKRWGGSRDLLTVDENWFEKKTPLTRLLLQVVGTDIVRRIYPLYWIEATVANIRQNPKEIVLLTDWRFGNEHVVLHDHFHTFTVRVNRDIPREGKEHQHESETALDARTHYNVVVDNNGTLEELKAQAQEIAYLLIEETMV